MPDIHQRNYFTVFEGTYSKFDSIGRRRAPAPQPQTGSKGTIAGLLIILLVGATTTAGALTALRANSTKADEPYAARYLKLPGVAHFEDALY